jgi:hypothetical protein
MRATQDFQSGRVRSRALRLRSGSALCDWSFATDYGDAEIVDVDLVLQSAIQVLADQT